MDMKVKIDKKMIFGLILHMAIIILSVLFLYIGHRIAVNGLSVFNQDENIRTLEVKIIKIVDISDNDVEWSGGSFNDRNITFEAAAKNAKNKEYITATQNINSLYFSFTKEVKEGDKVLLSSYAGGEWYFIDYVRIDKILFLGVIFIVLLLVFGRIKGLNAILSLGFTCTAIFAVFIPSLLSGKNIYMMSVIVCIYSVIVTLFIVNGINKKSFAAVIACFGGIIAIGVLTLVMDNILGLTGLISEESMYLTYIPTEKPIDLKAVIFAGIMIGAVGAVMDVAMSVSSALWELKTQASNPTFAGILKSGINIGKDIMGTMTNTLVLAYIGGSLSLVLLLFVYASSLAELMNRELVIVELLQAIIGSLGILLTMPLTALICALLYSHTHKNQDTEIDEEELARFRF